MEADLNQVGVPGILGYSEVIVALLLFMFVSIYRPYSNRVITVPSSSAVRRHDLYHSNVSIAWRRLHALGVRYLEALTNRPAMFGFLSE